MLTNVIGYLFGALLITCGVGGLCVIGFAVVELLVTPAVRMFRPDFGVWHNPDLLDLHRYSPRMTQEQVQQITAQYLHERKTGIKEATHVDVKHGRRSTTPDRDASVPQYSILCWPMHKPRPYWLCAKRVGREDSGVRFAFAPIESRRLLFSHAQACAYIEVLRTEYKHGQWVFICPGNSAARVENQAALEYSRTSAEAHYEQFERTELTAHD